MQETFTKKQELRHENINLYKKNGKLIQVFFYVIVLVLHI